MIQQLFSLFFNRFEFTGLDFRDGLKVKEQHVIGRISHDDPSEDGWYHMSGSFAIVDDSFEIPDRGESKFLFLLFLKKTYIFEKLCP